MNWPAFDALLTRIRPHRQVWALAIDLATVAVCWHVTYLFRLGVEKWQTDRPPYDSQVLAGLLVLYALSFLVAGVPRAMWRFSGFGEIRRLTLACFGAGSLGAVVVLMLQLSAVPRAVLALHPVVSLMGLAMVRIGYRMLYEHMRGRLSVADPTTRRALVMGGGDAARLLIAGLQHQGWQVLGCLDDDRTRQGARNNNVPVLGGLDEVGALAREHEATHVLIAMPSATTAQRRRALALAAGTRLPVLTMPGPGELQRGDAVARVRDIEADDLLGREPVQLDEAGISDTLSGKTVLITGAGGSIGAELCRQVAHYGPACLVLYELSEFNLYAIEQELGERFPHLRLERLIGDVRNLPHLRQTFQRLRPHVVFHAAAYKHVPLMEQDNAWAALSNNTLGTWHAAQAAAEAGVERFVLISTDKAVNPTNVMGASKRAAEMVLSHLAAQGHATRFMAVRFGNVLGSSGSVIPKFKAQIARGGPVTVTHPDITRYFMTIPEAARLVIQAAALGETGQVFVLDMGEPVKIAELARQLIQLAGYSLEEMPVVYTGLRPGEKLYEELLADADASAPTKIERLRIARLEQLGSAVPELLDWIAGCEVPPGVDEVRRRLAGVVTEYRLLSHRGPGGTPASASLPIDASAPVGGEAERIETNPMPSVRP